MSLPENTEYTRLLNPTKDQLYGVRSIESNPKPMRIEGINCLVVEKRATHGCFVGGLRKLYEVQHKLGMLDLGFGRSRGVEIIAWGATEREAVTKATAELLKRRKKTDKW